MATGLNRTSGRAAEEPGGIVSTELAITLVAALATTLMLEVTRVFLGYMVFVIDQSNRDLIAATSFGVFAAFIAGGVAAGVLRKRGAVLTTVSLLIVARLILQFTENPEARLILGGIAIVAWGWMLPPLRAIRPDDTARGVAYGLLLDLAIRFLFGTVDLPWMPDVWRHLMTVALALGLAITSIGVIRAKGYTAAGGAGPALLGVGPGLAVYHLLTGNLGIADAKTGFPIEMAVWIFAIGIAAGFAMQIRPPDSTRAKPLPAGWTVAAALTVFALVSLAVFWRWNGVGDLFAIIVASVGAQLIVLAVRGRGNVGEPPALLKDAAWLTLGMLLHAVLIFVYYSATGFPILIGVALVLLGLGAALSAGFKQPLPPITSGRHLPAMVVAAMLLLALGLVANRDAWAEVDRDDVLGAELTVMTYNIQSGFSRDNIWDLEATAQTIEAYQPDIVLLQEVSRGWIITSGVDEARWLSNRLDMNLVWGPSSQDGLWGLAILSRGDVLGSEMRIFDNTDNLRRGVQGAGIATDAAASGAYYVFNTHLDDPTEGGAVRFQQVTSLLTTIAEADPAILGGDFNAPPDSDVIAAILNADFVDTGANLPPELSTREDARRIDYVFVRGSFEVVEIITPDVWTSDHRPVVVKLRYVTG
jgi:endonuclease/exonuclease/phosphatase family metal-dependent hydrolase